METKVCTLQIACNGEPQPIENFPLRSRFTTRRQSYCKACKAKMHSNWYEENKEVQKESASRHRKEYKQILREYVWDYFSTHPCQSCGETDPIVLEFHHVGTKTIEVSILVNRGSSLEALKAEISKCIVLCRNCHARVTAEERGFYRK